MEPAIFKEFISLCYRMAMTEPANIQVHLVEMIAIFAASHGAGDTYAVLSLSEIWR